MTSLLATCGLRPGGQGSWRTIPGPRCQLEVSSSGLAEYLDSLTLLMTGWYKIGLYQSNTKPVLNSSIGDFTKCTFSGYNGERLLYGFSKGVMYGVRAKSFATPVVWVHNGGSIGNYVYGYYVINNKGALAFAERFCDGPFLVNRNGRSVKVTPTFSTKNERED